MNRKHTDAWVTILAIIGLMGLGSCGGAAPEDLSSEDEFILRYFDVKDLGFPPVVFHGNPPLDVPGSRPPEPPWPTVHGVPP